MRDQEQQQIKKVLERIESYGNDIIDISDAPSTKDVLKCVIVVLNSFTETDGLKIDD